MIRMSQVVRGVFAWAAIAATPALAQGQAWQVTDQGGDQVARVTTTGAMTGIAATCEKTIPLLAIRLSRAPTRNPAQLSLSVGGNNANLAIQRNGQTDIWIAIIRDTRVLDMLAGGDSVAVKIDGAAYGSVPLSGAGAAMAAAMPGCYRPAVSMAGGAKPGTAGPAPVAAGTARGIFTDASLPEAVRRDLGDFDQACASDDPVETMDGKFHGGRGVGVAGPGALKTADFNADGKPDHVVDIAKLRCSKTKPGDGTTFRRLMVYLSNADGATHAFDVEYVRWAIAPGSPAALQVHQDMVPDDDGEGHPVINETLRVTAGKWSPSKIANFDWRATGKLERYPAVLRPMVTDWDRTCASLGRRMTLSDEAVVAVSTDTNGATHKLDLNGDGKPDYVVDTDQIECGLFYIPAKGWKPCPDTCALIAIVSKPDGTYAATPLPGSITVMGNGDPASINYHGTKAVVCSPIYDGGSAMSMYRYAWTAAGMQRTLYKADAVC